MQKERRVSSRAVTNAAGVSIAASTKPKCSGGKQPRSEVPAKALAQHVGKLCRENGCIRSPVRGMMMAGNDELIPRISGWFTYHQALHRIGRQVTKQDGRHRYLMYSNEARAWEWALQMSLVRTDNNVRRLARLSLKHFLSEHRRPDQGELPADHSFSRLLLSLKDVPEDEL